MSKTIAQHAIVVFTDGASKGNPGPGGWGAIIATPEGHVTELGGGAAHTTNNKMELAGPIAALTYLRAITGKVDLYTDSTYVIRGITQWIYGWRRRDWKTAEGSPVLNRPQWEELARLVEGRGEANSIAWHYVAGHTGIPGNERVDAIADAFATDERIALFEGPLREYGTPIFDLPDDTSLPASKSKSAHPGKSKAAHSYLSVVDGKPMRHGTWPECERRVKGQSGARFKKAKSAADEAAILRSWGYSLGDL